MDYLINQALKDIYTLCNWFIIPDLLQKYYSQLCLLEAKKVKLHTNLLGSDTDCKKRSHNFLKLFQTHYKQENINKLYVKPDIQKISVTNHIVLSLYG